jgi:glutamate dehydrogenase/leucine dehydrogenase
VDVLKLENTDAFVVRDLGPDVPAVGVVRLAPKILREGAELLARSLTYAFASFERQVSGASAGINSKPDTRTEAVAAFVDGVRPFVESGQLRLDPARGVDASDLAPLDDVDTRTALYREHAAALRGSGAAVCANAARPLDGCTVAIEGFDASGPALVAAVYERGARVVAVSTAKGAAVQAQGFDGPALAQAFHEHGPAVVENVDGSGQPLDAFWKTDVDVLFCGSKAGVVDHDLADELAAKVVVPSGPVPVTAKALAALRRAGVVVLPDFLTTSAPLFALDAEAGATFDSVAAAAAVALEGAVSEVLADERGPLLGACRRAESFLATWRDELPFGRPLA